MLFTTLDLAKIGGQKLREIEQDPAEAILKTLKRNAKVSVDRLL